MAHVSPNQTSVFSGTCSRASWGSHKDCGRFVGSAVESMGSGVTPLPGAAAPAAGHLLPQQHLPSTALGKGHPSVALQPCPALVTPFSLAFWEPQLLSGSWTVFLCSSSCCSGSAACWALWPKALWAVLLRSHNNKKNVSLKIILALDYELLWGRKTQTANNKNHQQTPKHYGILLLSYWTIFLHLSRGKKVSLSFPLFRLKSTKSFQHVWIKPWMQCGKKKCITQGETYTSYKCCTLVLCK